MALVSCPECGKEISDKATTCPSCGCPVNIASIAKDIDKFTKKIEQDPKAGAKGCGCLIFVIVVIGVMMATCNSQPDSTPKTPEEKRKAEIQTLFSAWDGSNAELTKLIKSAMNDPGSYEHVETIYWDEVDHLIVRTTYSGKNAFGGRVKGTVKAKVDLNGNVIEILSEQ